ncbi:MAG: hypothetical protein II661_02430 [Bacteroidales bacterium]|nr:hypothetical protein [Bacteroidales bacterium]
MNFYSYVRTDRTKTAKEIAGAKKVTDLSVIVAANMVQDTYKFENSKELAAQIGKVISAEILLETLANGNLANRMKVVTDKGNFRFRTFGKKDNPEPARALTADEVKKLSFGFCKSGNEIVSDTKLNPTTGEVESVPRIYANIEAL